MSLLQKIRRYTSQALDEIKNPKDWTPFSPEAFQSMRTSLITKHTIAEKGDRPSATDYDSLASYAFSLSERFPSGEIWAAFLDESGDEYPNIFLAPFTKRGEIVGECFSMVADLDDPEYSKDIKAAFRQFPVLTIPTKFGGSIEVDGSFLGTSTSWGGSLLTYASAVRYFAYEGARLKEVGKRGALTCEPHGSCVWIEQLFIDDENNLVLASDESVLGRKCVFGSIDSELRDALGSNNLLVVS